MGVLGLPMEKRHRKSVSTSVQQNKANGKLPINDKMNSEDDINRNKGVEKDINDEGANERSIALANVTSKLSLLESQLLSQRLVSCLYMYLHNSLSITNLFYCRS